MNRLLVLSITVSLLISCVNCFAENVKIDADILIAGGTESGCAAAVQAARMGINKIVLVNDIEWLGGQFSAEGLGAIDENRAHGYDGTVPIPRSGLFREIIDAMEARNAELYGGVDRPGNTRVITTVRPVVAEQVFRALLRPYEESGQLKRFSNLQVLSAQLSGNRLRTVVFQSPTNPESTLTVNARITIDATDWGDVVKAAGAEYDFGIDSSAEFGEPNAPLSHQPETDMNPITWCAILEQQKTEVNFSRPAGFDARNLSGKWGWIDEDFAYTSRRLVDGAGFEQIDHPDLVLINNPNVDYPLDRYPASVASALEATAPGASAKNIVQLSPSQRQIIFADAKQRTLHYLFYLRQNFPRFRLMSLSGEFGTDDSLPPKPYIRESLRLVARHIITEQEVLGFGARSHYASTMYPDGVFSWQFELDFHPTMRKWVGGDQNEDGPWEADFRGNRRFGRGGTGRVMFPLRSLVPVRVRGLLGAQKNLGYTSIVGSSCRLHDQSVAVGQASGAVAAVSLQRDIDPANIWLDPASLSAVWDALLAGQGAGVAIWPFADVDPDDPGFAAIQQLALRRLWPIEASDIKFLPDQKVTPSWLDRVLAKLQDADLQCSFDQPPKTRREAAIEIWKQVAVQPHPQRRWLVPGDADDDGIADSRDPLPFAKGTVSWKQLPSWDGIPDADWEHADRVQRFNFTSASGPAIAGYVNDHGEPFSTDTGFGWSGDQTNSTRLRNVAAGTIRDGFVFTRQEDTWERELDNGEYIVTVCIGDAAHEQPGQQVMVEGEKVADNVATSRGVFREFTSTAAVADGRLTIVIGKREGGSNTTLNWVLIRPVE